MLMTGTVVILKSPLQDPYIHELYDRIVGLTTNPIDLLNITLLNAQNALSILNCTLAGVITLYTDSICQETLIRFGTAAPLQSTATIREKLLMDIHSFSILATRFYKDQLLFSNLLYQLDAQNLYLRVDCVNDGPHLHSVTTTIQMRT